MPDLPRHGSITACPKCGAPDGKIGAVYHENSRPFIRDGNPTVSCAGNFGIGEHLCRECGKCGFGWCEAVLAADEAGEPAGA
jgi:hypothetical protein